MKRLPPAEIIDSDSDFNSDIDSGQPSSSIGIPPEFDEN